MKSIRLQQGDQVARINEIRNYCRVFEEKYLGKWPIEILREKFKDNIKMVKRKIGVMMTSG